MPCFVTASARHYLSVVVGEVVAQVASSAGGGVGVRQLLEQCQARPRLRLQATVSRFTHWHKVEWQAIVVAALHCGNDTREDPRDTDFRHRTVVCRQGCHWLVVTLQNFAFQFMFENLLLINEVNLFKHFNFINNMYNYMVSNVKIPKWIT